MSTTGATLSRHSSKQDVATPPEFIKAVTEKFGPIAFDLAADSKNDVTHAGDYYGPGSSKGEDALVQDWDRLEGHLWLNPPFGKIEPWVRKCRETIFGASRLSISLLLPASVSSNWFARYVFGTARVYCLNGRIRFVGHEHDFPKDLILCRYGMLSGAEIWRWKETPHQVREP